MNTKPNKILEIEEVVTGNIRVSLKPQQVAELISMLANSLRANGFEKDLDLTIKANCFGVADREATFGYVGSIDSVKGKFEQLQIVSTALDDEKESE